MGHPDEPGEIRFNPISGRWVIQAPDRSQRPRDFTGASPSAEPPAHDPGCPFCPGQEDQLLGILAEHRIAEAPGWSVRVVPNRYPALDGRGTGPAQSVGPYQSMPAAGRHEVIIETPRHDLSLADLSQAELETVVDVYLQRYRALGADPVASFVLLFHNHGERAGTSLEHCHSQMIAMPFVPIEVTWRLARLRAHHQQTGRCLVCDLAMHETEAGSRVVEATDSFLAVVPFCASSPMEIWIIPRRHTPSFAALGETDISELAHVYGQCLTALRGAGQDPAFNVILHSPPPTDFDPSSSHWLLQVLPRSTTRAGLEIGVSVSINPSSPELDAARLRKSLQG